MHSPCHNCLIIPICRHKYFVDLKNECCLIEQFLFEGLIYDRRRPDFNKRIMEIYDAMNPAYWRVGITEDGDHHALNIVKGNYCFSYRERSNAMEYNATTYFHYSGPAPALQEKEK